MSSWVEIHPAYQLIKESAGNSVAWGGITAHAQSPPAILFVSFVWWRCEASGIWFPLCYDKNGMWQGLNWQWLDSQEKHGFKHETRSFRLSRVWASNSKPIPFPCASQITSAEVDELRPMGNTAASINPASKQMCPVLPTNFQWPCPTCTLVKKFYLRTWLEHQLPLGPHQGPHKIGNVSPINKQKNEVERIFWHHLGY